MLRSKETSRVNIFLSKVVWYPDQETTTTTTRYIGGDNFVNKTNLNETFLCLFGI